ncbi:MAG: helix-turn-helix transcriptional regulator [Eubacteriales bacterium]
MSVWTWDNGLFDGIRLPDIFGRLRKAALRTPDESTAVLRRDGVLQYGSAISFQKPDDSGFKYICLNLDLTREHTDIVKFVQPSLLSEYDESRIVERLDLPELRRPLIFTEDNGLAGTVREIFEEFLGGAPYSEARTSLLAADYLINAVRHSASDTSGRAALVADVKRYIHGHYGEQLTNSDIAASLGYHPYYLSRVFRETAGMTLHRYLLEYRLTTAYSQLALSPSPIERIAASCGFATASHFTAAFRKSTESSRASAAERGLCEKNPLPVVINCVFFEILLQSGLICDIIHLPL